MWEGTVVSIHIAPTGAASTVPVVQVRAIASKGLEGDLERLSHPGVREALIHRGGLRAQILTEGMIRVGDTAGEV